MSNKLIKENVTISDIQNKTKSDMYKLGQISKMEDEIKWLNELDEIDLDIDKDIMIEDRLKQLNQEIKEIKEVFK